MKIKEVITLFQYHQQSNLKQRTRDSYRFFLKALEATYGDRSFDSLGPDEICQFLEGLTVNRAKATRRLRYAQMKAFYNFIIEKCAITMKNPCNVPLLTKVFRPPKQAPRKILDKEIVDER